MSSPVQRTVDPTEQLCEFVTGVEYNDIPESVTEHAKLMIRDTLGVSIAATKTQPFERIRAAKRQDLNHGLSTARVPGTPIRASLGDAGLLNGILAHALDFDDVHPDMGGHPSSPVLSALLPISEQQNASGKEFLRAFILGTEVEITLANVLNPGHYERGWHPTAILGTVGAATAVGALCDQDDDTLRYAVGIAASQAGGIKANFGTMTKSYHVGRAARSAIEAAQLAEEGFTSNPDALETDFGGFCDLFQGTPGYDFADHIEKLGNPWKILSPKVGFKPYPCCGSTHGAIDAALAIRENLDGNLDLECVKSIEIEEHPRRLGHTNRPYPRTPLDAKFSVQYCVTSALRNGDVWFDHFTLEAVEGDRQNVPLDRVTIQERPEEFANDDWGAEVIVRLTDGTEESVRIPAPKGSADNPMTDKELEHKYGRCVAHVLPKERASESISLFERLENLDDVTELLDVLTS
ncbi:MmgE/PrpD family protein [Haladaptatus pallidirubidus]|nr:MmgE/PrpD family protein [Haladaptatus pallidirubidus]